MAFRHTPRVRMYIGGDWRDVTTHVRADAKVTISRGRGSPSTSTPPSTCSFVLNNDDLRYSSRNPISPYYGLIGRNTPVEVSETLGVDTFERNVTNGWGSTDTGQSWSLFGGGGTVAQSDLQVAAGKGTMSVPVVAGNRVCLLAADTYLDVDVMVDVSVSVSNITGGDIEPGNIYLRSDAAAGTYYMCRVVITSAEAVTVTFHHSSAGQLATPVTIAGLTHSAAQTLRVRAQVEGNTLRAKVWAASTGEPYDWAIAVSDTRIVTAGRVGLRNGVAAANTNALPWVFSNDNLTISSMRYAGEIGALPTDSDVSNKVKTVSIEAAGILRRLGQGDAPVQSVMRRAVLGLGTPLLAYWPCEDIDGTLPGPSSALPGGQAMSGVPDYEADDSAFLCSDKLPTMGGAFLYGQVPAHTSSGREQVRWLMQIPAAGITNGAIILRIFTQGGSTGYWAVTYNTGGGLSLTIFNKYGAQIFSSGYGFSVNGNARRYSLELMQNGADIDWALSEVFGTGASGVSGTLAGNTFGQISEVFFAPDGDTVIGHVSAENQVTSTFALQAQLAAFTGETSVARLIRLCAENDVPFSYVGTSAASTPMGPQRVNTLLTLLRECEAADAGALYEPRGTVGLAYRTRTSSYALTPTVTIDASLKQLRHPFQPVEDDRATANDVTVKRTGGGEYRRTLDVGRMSTLAPPSGVGRYATSYDANVSTAADGGYLADWLLTLGTIDEPRYPNLGLHFDAPTVVVLERAARDLDIGHLVRVTNAGSMVGIYDPIDQLLFGCRETLSNYEHVIAINAEPYAPFAVTVLDSASTLIDSGTSRLTAGYSSSATSLSVTTNDPGDLFATAGIFPLVITVAGETMTVSAIAGATSPQTFTVSRSTNGVVKAQVAGAIVHVLTPTRLGL